jgi:hypothetical protein
VQLKVEGGRQIDNCPSAARLKETRKGQTNERSDKKKIFLMDGLLGGELPFPIHGGFSPHIDDVAEIHLRVALEEAYASKDVGEKTPDRFR